MAYTKKERSTAAKKGWNGRKNRFWVVGGVKPINKVPTGKVGVLINK
ncbi:MAG: hypothetical protein PHQ43_05345 [Dehalococcoidales bacterium]|nr:hypothetical protein [Dehalococcoidales bacterium]